MKFSQRLILAVAAGVSLYYNSQPSPPEGLEISLIGSGALTKPNRLGLDDDVLKQAFWLQENQDKKLSDFLNNLDNRTFYELPRNQ